MKEGSLERPRHRWEVLLILISNSVVGYGLNLSTSGWGPMAGCCKDGDEHSRSVKSGQVLNRLSYY